MPWDWANKHYRVYQEKKVFSFYFLFFLQKLSCFHLSAAQERSPGWLKKKICLVTYRLEALTPGACRWVPLGFEAPSPARGCALRCSLRAPPAGASHAVHFLDEFHPFIQGVTLLMTSQRRAVCADRTQGLVQGLPGFTPLILGGPLMFWRRVTHWASFTSLRDSHCPPASPGPLRRSDSHAPEPQWHSATRCPWSRVQGGPQMADQVVESGLYLAGIILMNLVGSEALTTKTGVVQS